MHTPLPQELAEEFSKAASILDHFINGKTKLDATLIPSHIVANAKGVAVLTILKAGFIWSGRAGAGLVVAKLSDGRWSAPSAIAAGGAGVGVQIGAECTDSVFILNTDGAIRAFSHGGNVSFGANLSIAAGPVGRSAEGAGTVGNFAPIYAYSKTKGLFAGVSFEGLVIITRKETNARFYGAHVTPTELLNGKIQPPVEAECLYRALNVKGFGSRNRVFDKNNSNNDNSNNSINNSEYSTSCTSSQYSYPSSSKSPFNLPPPPPPHPKATLQNISGVLMPPPRPIPPTYVQEYQSSSAIIPPRPNSQLQYNIAQRSQPTPPPAYANLQQPNNTSIPVTSQFQQQQQAFQFGEKKTPKFKLPTKPVPPPPPQLPAKFAGKKLKTAIAQYDFHGERPGDLAFVVGDKITVLNENGDWWEGELKGARGIFPANYVE
ncbi:hypothetical protein HK100_004307 [Physocladia obscura]|uniref:SH3 domain-containing protein n=1 Tax=Physocladia obscura TaxID=109957 RepID=A0AAD5SUK4_9FUNG|nr:hypothetical protein HK100_004307 [Physocladia obscura]